MSGNQAIQEGSSGLMMISFTYFIFCSLLDDLYQKLQLLFPGRAITKVFGLLNVVLLFQPPYSPQVNPIERFWKELKKKLRWKLFENLDELRERLSKEINKLTPELISSVSGWQFIREALSVANI